jgi:hypothetical protein
MNRHLFRTTVIATTVAMFAGACSSAPGASASGVDGDLEAGLELTSASDDHAAGEFTENGTRLSFEIARTADGVTTMAVRTADDQPLIEATRVGDRVDSSYFGGQLRISGPAALLAANQSLLADELGRLAAQASFVGDTTALDRASAMPELALLDDLGDSLDAAGVFADLVARGQLQATDVEKSANVLPADCGFFEAIACASVIAICAASVGADPSGTLMLACLVSLGAASCFACTQ